mmetsp:Transcript_551/g.772  ORF Transcript_551/g.772 Transcript_551/m.772 type:complete len:235 (+) Transcript_551:174-878(+)
MRLNIKASRERIKTGCILESAHRKVTKLVHLVDAIIKDHRQILERHLVILEPQIDIIHQHSESRSCSIINIDLILCALCHILIIQHIRSNLPFLNHFAFTPIQQHLFLMSLLILCLPRRQHSHRRRRSIQRTHFCHIHAVIVQTHRARQRIISIAMSRCIVERFVGLLALRQHTRTLLLPDGIQVIIRRRIHMSYQRRLRNNLFIHCGASFLSRRDLNAGNLHQKVQLGAGNNR